MCLVCRRQIEVLNTATGAYGLFANNAELIYYWNGTTELVQAPKDAEYSALLYMQDGNDDEAFDGQVR